MLYAKKIVVQCQYDMDAIIKRHFLIEKILKKKMIVQINNINTSWMDIVLKHGTRNTSFSIVSVNDFSSTRKGCDIFLEAMLLLNKLKIDFKAFIVGDGKLLSFYKNKYRKCKNIFFVGRIKNAVDFIVDKDLVVVPSRADSCPNTVLEALRNNIPVIGSNCGGIPELLKYDLALFEPNAESLKDKIVYYMNKTNIETLRKIQLDRSKELEFNWVEKIYRIVEKDDECKI